MQHYYVESNLRPIIPRRFSLNLVHMLSDREIGIDRRKSRCQRTVQSDREFFKTKTPNLTIANVGKPLGYIRKFSPDGKYLLVISPDQQSLEVYTFLGVANAASLLYPYKKEFVRGDDTGYSFEIRSLIFDKLFSLKWSIRLTSFRKPLHREFSIFVENSNYILLASHTPVSDDNTPSFYDLHTSNEINSDCELSNYEIYFIDFKRGSINDVLQYNRDSIVLPHNHGVSVYKNMMAILSIFRQSIEIFQLCGGKFRKLFTIGRFCSSVDERIFNEVPENAQAPSFKEATLSAIKQRVMAALYRRILDFPTSNLRRKMLHQFYKNFYLYEKLVIYKVQLIDRKHLLIRYEQERRDPSEFDVKLYVFYNIFECEVVNVYGQSSLELLWIVTNFTDIFRNVRSLQSQRPPSSSSNNIYVKSALEKLIESLSSLREAAFRLNAQLPISTQSFSASPYLDLNIFNYDDCFISAIERPKHSNMEPIRFSDYVTDITLFRMHPGIYSKLPIYRELVAFTCHPCEPFIISVQKISSQYIVNFHIYNESTMVTK